MISLSDRACNCSFVESLERRWLKNHPVWHPSGADTAMVSSFYRWQISRWRRIENNTACHPSIRLSVLFFFFGPSCWNEVHAQSTAAHASFISSCGSLYMCVCVCELSERRHCMRFSLRQYLPSPRKSPKSLFLLTLPEEVVCVLEL